MTEDLQNLVLDVLLQQAPGFAGSRISYRNSRISVNTEATNNDSFVKGMIFLIISGEKEHIFEKLQFMTLFSVFQQDIMREFL